MADLVFNYKVWLTVLVIACCLLLVCNYFYDRVAVKKKKKGSRRWYSQEEYCAVKAEAIMYKNLYESEKKLTASATEMVEELTDEIKNRDSLDPD